MKADVRLDKMDLFRFMFYHMYMRPTGLIYLLVGMGALAAGIWFLSSGNGSGVFLIVISAVYFVLQPLFLYMKAAQQSRQEVLQRNTVYLIDGTGLHAFQGADSSSLPWDKVYKAVVFAGELIIYMTDVRANIIPIRTIQDKEETLSFLQEMLPKKKRRGF